MKIQPEQAEQIRIADWMRIMHPDIPFFAFANERKCSLQYGALLKRMGVKPGVSDLFFSRSNLTHHGLWLELKVGKNKPTPYQIQFLQERREEGYKAEWCIGADKAIELIKEFYSLK
jgi:hypothetical protein